MSADKRLNQWGALAKIESTYGTDAAPDGATDGLLLAERPEVSYDFIHDGSRNGDMAPQSRGPAPRVAPSGKYGESTLHAEAVGAGVAYSASDVPSIDVLLRMACLSQTVDVTVGSESVTYAPATSGFESATLELYSRGQLDKLLGAYVKSFTVGADGPVIPQWQFDVMGIAGDESEASIPSITSYPASNLLPPKSVNVQLSLNGVTDLILRSWTFDLGQDMSPRADDNSTGGHAGFTPAGISPTLELVVEAAAFSDLNPYSLRDARTQFAVSLQNGSTQYNEFSLSASKAQILDVAEDADGASALWHMTLGLYPSSYTTADQFSIVFD